MPRQRPHLILVFSALLAIPAAAQQEGVHWQQDIESAKAVAKQTGRLVLVHFWTPSCAPCLVLDQNVFNQPGVAGALEAQFVPVKLNANENSATAQGFGITRVPTDVVLTPDGQVVGKLISPPTPAAYIAEVSRVAGQQSTKAGQTFAKAAAAAPMPPQLNAAYASLQIDPHIPPAIAAQQPATPDQHSRVATPPSSPQAAVGGAPFVQSGTFAAWVPTSPAVVSSTPAQPTGPLAQGPSATVDNRYALPAGGNVSPSETPAVPRQVANPYAPDAAATPPAASVPPATAGPSPAIGAAGPAMPAGVGAGPPPAQAAIPAGANLAGPDATRLPPNAPPLGFEGYCPVSMRNQWKWVPGDPRWGIVHRGRTYWFAGQKEQQQFWADPDRYSPALSGMDPVLAIDHQQQVPGKREHSLDYDNLFYMFASEATLQQFTANPERYSSSVRQAMGIQRDRLVR